MLWEWIALFPLLVIAVLDVQIEQAIAPAQRLLAPPQMWLPDPLEEAWNEAILCWEDNKSEDLLLHLNRSVEVAKQYGCL